MFNHIVEGKPRGGSEHKYAEPNATAELHSSVTGPWRILEWLPKKVKWREWPKRKTMFGYYLPRCEPRPIQEGAWIHESVFERQKFMQSYRPQNLPTVYEVEK